MSIEKLTRVKLVKWGYKPSKSTNNVPEPLKSVFFYVEDEAYIMEIVGTNLDNIHLEKYGEVKKR